MTNEVWLIGAGGHAKVVMATFQAAGWTVCGAFDQNRDLHGARLLDVTVMGDPPAQTWWQEQHLKAFLSIGSNAARCRLAMAFGGVTWAQAVHPTAILHGSAGVGPGVLVAAHAIIQPDVTVGAHAIINTGAVVEHDNAIGPFCHLGPRSCLAGNVTVGEGGFVGAGATILPGVQIGAWSVVGAGAVVVGDVPEGTTVAGVPARTIIRATPKAQGM